MRHNLLFLASVIGSLIFSSCGQDHAIELEIENELRKEVKVNAYFYEATGNGSITTRATDKAWEKDDAIGLFMKKSGTVLVQPCLAENVEFKTDGNGSFICALTDKIYFPFNKEEVDFISYHPYKSSLDGLNYMVDVSDQITLSAIDLLYSNNAKNKNSDSEKVDLIFEHQLTKVVFKIDTNNSGKDLSNLTAKITNVNTKANFSLIDGSLTDKSAPASVSLNVDTKGTFLKAILLPDDDLSNKDLIIDIAGTTYTYSLINSTEISSFDKSKKCEYNITLNAGQGPNIESVTTTITDWTSVSDDIIVTEDPSATAPVDPAPKPDEGDDSDSSEEGDGTQENPYNITQAIQLLEGTDKIKPDKVFIIRNVWIKGYIVGHYSDMFFSKFFNSTEKATDSNFSLALSPEETDCQNMFHVNLLTSHSNIKNNVNLKNNSDHFKREITLLGNINYLSTSYSGVIYGMEKIFKAIINDITYTS